MAKRKTTFSLKQAVHFLELGMIKGSDADWVKKQIERNKSIKDDDPIGLQHIVSILLELKIPYKREHRFHDKRRFRFDLAITEHKIAIEYEGIFSKHSRHTNVKGYSVDADKYNLAQSLGWTVLRYTAMNYKKFDNDIKQLINEKEDTILQK